MQKNDSTVGAQSQRWLYRLRWSNTEKFTEQRKRGGERGRGYFHSLARQQQLVDSADYIRPSLRFRDVLQFPVALCSNVTRARNETERTGALALSLAPSPSRRPSRFPAPLISAAYFSVPSGVSLARPVRREAPRAERPRSVAEQTRGGRKGRGKAYRWNEGRRRKGQRCWTQCSLDGCILCAGPAPPVIGRHSIAAH